MVGMRRELPQKREEQIKEEDEGTDSDDAVIHESGPSSSSSSL